jgi:signal transduction histidine kinase
MGLDYKSVLQMLSSDNHELDKTNDPVFDVLSTNQPKRRNDLQLQTSSGKKLIIEVVVSPLGRQGSGAIIVFRDITKEQEEERAQAEFISTASHEMRTPVASIEGYLGLALNPATATIDAKAHDYITKAHLAAEHLGRLFQDLLDVTKADDGRMQNNPKVIEVVSFTSDVVEGLQPKADEKQLKLFFKANSSEQGGGRTIEPIYYVDLDADHLREVLANLVENAIKYTPKGEVVIDIEGDEDHVVVSIRDSGIGIPAEDIPHLFQKFYRVDNSDTREIGGTGLGLYLCRRLVEAMGGRIWVESEYKKGSTFSVELPRISHEEAQRLIDATMIPNASGTIPLPSEEPAEAEVTDGSMTSSERQQALATPIIVDHNPAVSVSSASIDVPKTAVMIDPLVGNPAPVATASGTTRPQPATVLPPAWQAVQPVVQRAPVPPRPTPVTPAVVVAPTASTPAVAPASAAPVQPTVAPQPRPVPIASVPQKP